MKVYIVRHGQTDWNVIKRLQGQSDTDLNDTGREQARIAAGTLSDVNFSHCFSSPLVRAVHTAELLLGKRKVNIVTDDRLKEVGFGINEGVQPELRTPGTELFFSNPVNYKALPGAESFEELNARTADFIDTVLVPLSEREPDATVLLVGHGAMNRSLLQRLAGLDLEHFWNGPVTKNLYCCVFEINGESFSMLEDFHSLLGE